jgi:hypothetical protein
MVLLCVGGVFEWGVTWETVRLGGEVTMSKPTNINIIIDRFSCDAKQNQAPNPVNPIQHTGEEEDCGREVRLVRVRGKSGLCREKG